MIYLHFLFAHLVGDYLLQNGFIVKWKRRAIVGLVIHTLLVSLAFLVVLFPYLHDRRVLIAIVVNFVLHTIQDRLKPKIEGFWPGRPFVPYVLDQFFHILVLLLLAAWVADVEPILSHPGLLSFYMNPVIWGYLFGLLVVSYTADISLHIWRAPPHRATDYERNFPAMAARIGVFTLLYGLGVALLSQ